MLFLDKKLHNLKKIDQYILGEKMKKWAIVMVILFVILLIFNPKEMIRIRVLANSDSPYDQSVKQEVVSLVKTKFQSILRDASSISEARLKIEDNLENVLTAVDTYLLENEVDYKANINFGLNYFPVKEYNGENYDEGYYESVLITLGKGEGANWWCILFPSVCLNEESVKYESFLKNLFTRILD